MFYEGLKYLREVCFVFGQFYSDEYLLQTDTDFTQVEVSELFIQFGSGHYSIFNTLDNDHPRLKA